jgi:two-component system OmpR family sensor kinase
VQLLPTTLTGRIVMITVVLVAAMAALIGTATTLAMRDQLNDRLDRDVRAALDRAVHAGGPGAPVGPPPRDRDGPRGDRGGFETVPGQGEGTVIADCSASSSSDWEGELVGAGPGTALSSNQALQVCDPTRGEGLRTVHVPDLGDYRVMIVQLQNGQVVVAAGLPTKDVDDAIGSLILWEYALGALAALIAGGLAVLVVRRQLQPLREVAATAHEVAGLPLASGEVGHTARVPEHLTDEHTEVGQVGLALNTLLGHMEQSLDARHRSELQVRQFVADASHELRTPLTTIQGYAELALRGDEPGELRLAMGKVKSESDRMRSLVEDLLLLARLDAGRPLERADVDLTRLALETVQDARVVSSDHRWALDLEAEAVVVPGDELRLHQVLTNLLTNARRHTPPGTTVTVSVRGGADAVVTVADDGPGVPPDLQARIFERFTRGDSARTRSSGGAGLGLSLAQAITAAHGGTLTVDSRPGATNFTLMLPR